MQNIFSSRGEMFLFAGIIHYPREDRALSSRGEFTTFAKVVKSITIEWEQMPCKSSPKALYNRRICLDFTVYCFYVILFRLFESLFGIFTFFGLARIVLTSAWKLACMLRECSLFSLGINRPLFALCMKQFKMLQIENSFVPINRQSSQPTLSYRVGN